MNTPPSRAEGYPARNFMKKGTWHPTEDQREKSRQCKLSENNPNWRGENTGIIGLHSWVRRRLPKPDRCSKCGNIGFIELACIGHNYKRDLSVWTYLCRSCHSSIDQKVLNINGNRKTSNCLTCGIEIKKPWQYCSECSRQRRLDWWKQYNKKRRSGCGQGSMSLDAVDAAG